MGLIRDSLSDIHDLFIVLFKLIFKPPPYVEAIRRDKSFVDKNDNRGSVMIKAVATAVEPAERAAGQAQVQPLYLEALTLVERLHRRLLDVIRDEFDRRGRADINSVQALLLYNIGDK